MPLLELTGAPVPDLTAAAGAGAVTTAPAGAGAVTTAPAGAGAVPMLAPLSARRAFGSVLIVPLALEPAAAPVAEFAAPALLGAPPVVAEPLAPALALAPAPVLAPVEAPPVAPPVPWASAGTDRKQAATAQARCLSFMRISLE
jgi:hypothetical protein